MVSPGFTVDGPVLSKDRTAVRRRRLATRGMLLLGSGSSSFARTVGWLTSFVAQVSRTLNSRRTALICWEARSGRLQETLPFPIEQPDGRVPPIGWSPAGI